MTEDKVTCTIEVKNRCGRLCGYPADGDEMALDLLALTGNKSFTAEQMPIVERIVKRAAMRLEQLAVGLAKSDIQRWKDKREGKFNTPIDLPPKAG